MLYVQQPQADQVITQFLGGATGHAVHPTARDPTAWSHDHHDHDLPADHGGRWLHPEHLASSSTTTTIETDFDPTPC